MTAVPDEVREALAGRPEVGATDQAFLFTTVDDDGLPHCCLLSRAEVEADADGFRVVLAGQGTIGNLLARGHATLAVFAEDAGWYCKLDLVDSRAEDDGFLGAVLALRSVKRDAVGVELEGARFTPTEEIRSVERWERTERLLAALVSSA